ncbi:hypothetical protein [Phycicoccus flavus]|uniref:Uncharacterized protein n=1 Tax=Phycicoccus flavus TaxID=2502783 RepID=A0A8T6RDU2_9MICO|nr:hypothetical protein [Phycicoccus flavus]NHA70341.1 hypothetical protein [Phycicoccus flavus]
MAPEEVVFVEELRQLGVTVHGVHQIREPAARADVRDVIFDHLGRDYSDYVRGRLAGVLGGPWIGDDEFDRLVTAYRSEASDHVREQLADSVARSAGGRLDQVVPLIGVRTRTFGFAHVRRVRVPEGSGIRRESWVRR